MKKKKKKKFRFAPTTSTTIKTAERKILKRLPTLDVPKRRKKKSCAKKRKSLTLDERQALE
ncbi:MAG: hypothetical protein J6K19_03950 [Prevotella sp.]|nr:hypothetical protein [Prevotella sp.]